MRVTQVTFTIVDSRQKPSGVRRVAVGVRGPGIAYCYVDESPEHTIDVDGEECEVASG